MSRRRYFTLIARAPGHQWFPQFGDYERETVELEMDYYRSDGSWPKGTQFRIVISGDAQVDVDYAVRRLNARAAP